MADAQTTETSTTTETAADAPETSGLSALDVESILGSTQTVSDTEQAQPTDPEKPADEPQQGAPPAEDPFSDKALATPEGIKAAQRVLRAEKTKWLDKHTENDRRARKLTDKVNGFKAERTTFALAKQQFDADVGALQRGDGKTRLEALARLCKQPAHALYEDLSLAVMNLGKAAPKLPPEVQAALDRVEALEAARKAEVEQEKQTRTKADEDARRNQWFGEQVTQIQAIVPKYKLVAAEAEDDAQGVVHAVLAATAKILRDTGKAPSYEEVISQREKTLLDRYQRTQASSGSAPQGEGNRAIPTNQPATAQRPPGQTVTQTAATQTTAVRSQTEQERLKSLADDIEAYFP